MDEDSVFTKRFVDCVRKSHEEREDKVSLWDAGLAGRAGGGGPLLSFVLRSQSGQSPSTCNGAGWPACVGPTGPLDGVVNVLGDCPVLDTRIVCHLNCSTHLDSCRLGLYGFVWCPEWLLVRDALMEEHDAHGLTLNDGSVPLIPTAKTALPPTFFSPCSLCLCASVCRMPTLLSVSGCYVDTLFGCQCIWTKACVVL